MAYENWTIEDCIDFAFSEGILGDDQVESMTKRLEELEDYKSMYEGLCK